MFPRWLSYAVITIAVCSTGSALANDKNPYHMISYDLVSELVSQLGDSHNDTHYDNIGVTRWVLAETMAQPEAGDSLYGLSHQLSEGLYADLKDQGLDVVEFRAQDYITLTSKGATALTRNADNLETQPKLDWILVGSLARKDAGAMVNVRIIDRYSQEVLAAANRYVPKQLYWPNKQTEIVDGRLQRH
jgi:hypothetical protein